MRSRLALSRFRRGREAEIDRAMARSRARAPRANRVLDAAISLDIDRYCRDGVALSRRDTLALAAIMTILDLCLDVGTDIDHASEAEMIGEIGRMRLLPDAVMAVDSVALDADWGRE